MPALVIFIITLSSGLAFPSPLEGLPQPLQAVPLFIEQLGHVKSPRVKEADVSSSLSGRVSWGVSDTRRRFQGPRTERQVWPQGGRSPGLGSSRPLAAGAGTSHRAPQRGRTARNQPTGERGPGAAYRGQQRHLPAGEPPLAVQLGRQDAQDHHLHGIGHLRGQGNTVRPGGCLAPGWLLGTQGGCRHLTPPAQRPRNLAVHTPHTPGTPATKKLQALPDEMR